MLRLGSLKSSHLVTFLPDPKIHQGTKTLSFQIQNLCFFIVRLTLLLGNPVHTDFLKQLVLLVSSPYLIRFRTWLLKLISFNYVTFLYIDRNTNYLLCAYFLRFVFS